MIINLKENDTRGRKIIQDSCIVENIVSRIYNAHILGFVSNMLAHYEPFDYKNNFKYYKKYFKTIGFYEAVLEIFERIEEIYGFGDKFHFDLYKGAIPEKLIYEIIKPEYSNEDCHCERESLVEINGLVCGFNVDVAGWNCTHERGDAYECKFWIRVNTNEIQNLTEIQEKSTGKIEPHIFTLTTKENYEDSLREVLPDCNIDIIGQNEIFAE